IYMFWRASRVAAMDGSTVHLSHQHLLSRPIPAGIASTDGREQEKSYPGRLSDQAAAFIRDGSLGHRALGQPLGDRRQGLLGAALPAVLDAAHGHLRQPRTLGQLGTREPRVQ